MRIVTRWLKVNGDSIYDSKPWNYQNDTNDIWYTKKQISNRDIVYAIVLEYPYKTNTVSLKSVGKFVDNETKVELLGYTGEIKVI